MDSRVRLLRGLLPAAVLVVALSLSGLALPKFAAAQTKTASLTRKVGKYQVDLRIPQGGLFAEEETDVEFHVSDASQDDPIQGAPPVVKAKVSARVTMPAMRAMPAQSPKTHSEGVPGDYGVVMYFPHGGEYQIDLTITPLTSEPFTVSYRVPVDDPQTGRKRKPGTKPYTLEVTANPSTPEAGMPSELTILVRSRETGQPVTEFDTVHEREMHFMVVSADLQRFAHEHPLAGKDGSFTLQYTFPTGGEYHLFADVAPHGAGSQILMQPIRVSGAAPVSTGNREFLPSLTDTAEGVRVAFASDPAKLPVGRSLNIAFTLKDANNAPITDLEPYLGAMAHLMLIHQDGITFVHSHPDETDPANGHKGSLTFLARFPKPGFYRAWLQFQRAGKVETVTFTWEVKGGRRE